MSIQISNQQYTLSNMTQDQIDLIKRTICKGCSNDELELFLYTCNSLGLNPLLKQIYALKRKSMNQETGKWEETMTIQTGIDGYRLIADRTGKYMPGKENTYTYDKDGRLFSATAYIRKLASDGIWHEIAATAFWSEYVQTKKDGEPTKFWKQMPHGQLGKCAETLAIKRAFPAETAGVRTNEEMEQADSEVIEVKANKNTGEIEHKAPPVEPKMSMQQDVILMEKIGDDILYRNKIFAAYGAKSFLDIPAKHYDLILSRIEVHNKERLEEEMKTLETKND